MLKEPLPNNELRAMQETHAAFNYIMPCWWNLIENVIMLHMFTNNCNSRSCFALGQAHDPKRAHVGRSPEFHLPCKIWNSNDEDGNYAQNFEHQHQHLQVSRTDVAKPHQFCAQVQRFTMQESWISPSSPRFNASMINTIEDPLEELCLKHRRCTCWNQHGADCSDGKKGHNSLN